MRVGHVVASASRCGSGVFHVVRNLTLNTQMLGHEVTVFGLKDEFTEADMPAWRTVPVKVHSILGPRNFGFSPELVRSIRDSGIDSLHTHGLWQYPSIAGSVACRRGNLPSVVTPHGMLDPWALGNSRWKKRLAMWLFEGAHLRQASCLHALSESEAFSIRAAGLQNPICVIPNGQYLPPDVSPADHPECNDLAPGKRVLLFLGRLSPQKGLPNLLRAWASCQTAQAEARNWVLVLVGGEERGHGPLLRRMVSELGIAESVFFPGPLFNSKKDRALRRADAFVLPSNMEGLPLAVLEAWAYRLPVLMTPQCNLPEGFEVGAALKAETAVASLTEGLRTLFSMSDADRHAMGARARRLVEQRFSWARAAEQMVLVYNWVLGGGPRPYCVLEC